MHALIPYLEERKDDSDDETTVRSKKWEKAHLVQSKLRSDFDSDFEFGV
jgi:hypothetical protein